MDRILNALYWDYRRDIGAGIAYPLEVPNSTFVPNMADNCHFILVITKCENSIPLLHMLSNFCANHKPSIICDPFIRDNVPNIRVTLNCVHSLVHVFVNYVHRLGHECLHLGSNHCTLCYSDSHTTAECTQCLICNPYESVCNDFRKCDKNKGVAFKKLPHQLSTNGTTRRQREKLIRDGNLTVHFSKIGSIYEYHYKEGEIVSHFVGMCVEKCIGLSGIGSPAVSVIITTKQKGKNIQTILYCIINNNKCMENSNTLFSGVSANESAKGISPVEAKHKVLKHCANKVVFTHNGAGDWHSLNITGQDLMKHNIRIIDLSKLPYFQCDQGENGSLFNSLADISAFLSLDDDNNVKRKIQIYDKVVRSCAYHSIEQNSRATCAAGLELIRRLRDHDKPLPTYRDVAQVGKRLKLHPKTADIVYKHLTDKDSECGDNAGIADQKYRNTDRMDPMIACLQKHFSTAFDNRLDSDLRFIVENQYIYCHKTVLKIRNKEFWEICEQNMFTEREIEINAYSYDTIKAFLMYLYGLRPEVYDQNCRQLLGLAEEYGERGLKDMCIQYLMKFV